MNAQNQDSGFITECKVAVSEKGYEIRIDFNSGFYEMTTSTNSAIYRSTHVLHC